MRAHYQPPHGINVAAAMIKNTTSRNSTNANFFTSVATFVAVAVIVSAMVVMDIVVTAIVTDQSTDHQPCNRGGNRYVLLLLGHGFPMGAASQKDNRKNQ